MLQLTCNNDPDTLKAVLEYGEKEKFEPRWERKFSQEVEDQTNGVSERNPSIEDPVVEKRKTLKKNHEEMQKEFRKKNPIMIASQNNYDICTQLLYSSGYRIPQTKAERKPGEREDEMMEGEEEKSRLKIVMKPPNLDNTVEKLLLFKAYSNPQYLSMALTSDKRIEKLSIAEEIESKEEDKDKEILKDLQRIDPLRRAFVLAEGAERLSTNVEGFSELRNSYKEIQTELEGFTQSILTQCSNMDEVRSILEHNPDDWDDDDDDSEKQNWQVAVWEGRKEFVAHPFFQQYIKKRMDVPCKIFGKNMKKKIGAWVKSDILLNLTFMPLSLLIFSFFPIIVFADFFRKADILFVSDKVWQERQMDKKENVVFRFFRRAIHTKTLSMTVAHVMHAWYISLLVYIVFTQKYDQVELQFCISFYSSLLNTQFIGIHTSEWPNKKRVIDTTHTF